MTPSLLHRAAGSARIMVRLVGQRRVPYLPEAEWRARRDRRVQGTVRHAAANVPYCRRLFRRLGLDPRAIRHAEDLSQLPLLDKGAIRENPQDFVARSPQTRHALELRTSGSSGVPLTVWHDAASILDNVAYTERERAVVGQALGGRRRFRTLRQIYEVRAYVSRHSLLPPAAPRGRASPEDPVERVVEAVERFHPDVVAGNGPFLELVFRRILAEGARIHPPVIVVFHGQAMSEAGRELIEGRLGIPVYSRYNAVEALRIGYTCEARDGFHLHSDLTHVRVVGSDGADLPPGQTGEVVISNLVNRAMVLLNYRLGDRAAFAPGPCRCGRTLPRLGEIEGRSEEALVLPGGRALHPRAVWSLFKPRQEVLQYQLVQHSPERYEIRLRTVDRSAFDRILPPVTQRLRELLGPEAILEASFHERLDGPGRGKFRAIVPYVPADDERGP